MKSLILALLPLWHSQWHKFPKGEEGEVVLLIRGEKRRRVCLAAASTLFHPYGSFGTIVALHKPAKKDVRMEYGYARVSTKEQNLARQLDALYGLGLNKQQIFTDKASGRNFKRPAYQRLLRRLKPGDVLFVKSIDRLGRNYEEILEEWRRITSRKSAHIVILDMPLLDTRIDKGGLTGVLITDIVLQLLSYVAQVERENIKQRQAEGIASAKARGVSFGRPRIQRPPCYGEVKQAFQEGILTRKEAAAQLGISTTTFDTWRKNDRQGELLRLEPPSS